MHVLLICTLTVEFSVIPFLQIMLSIMAGEISPKFTALGVLPSLEMLMMWHIAGVRRLNWVDGGGGGVPVNGAFWHRNIKKVHSPKRKKCSCCREHVGFGDDIVYLMMIMVRIPPAYKCNCSLLERLIFKLLSSHIVAIGFFILMY